ncbi:MAG: amidohydrolase [Bacillota bacterium]|nr:amidohydrolase [Bacillota bacterium]
MLKFINGNIITMQTESDIVEAFVIDKDRIIAVGTNKEINEIFIDMPTVNLKGKTVLPGFNDSHMHMLGLGMNLNQLDLSDTTSIEEIKARASEYSKTHEIVYGRGWNQDHFEENRLLTKEDLDEVSKTKPVILTRICGHLLVANSAAMKLSNTYNENGIFKESEMEKVKSILPKVNKKDIQKYLEDASDELLKNGITSVQSDDLSAVNEDQHKLVFETFEDMNLNIRVYEQSNFAAYDNYMKYIPNYRQDKEKNSFFRYGPIKILGDGSLGARTAKLTEPYHDSKDSVGILNFSQDELNNIVSLSHERKIDVAIHSIGDQMLKNALESLNGKKARHSIVHCQVTSKPLLKELARQNPVLHIQPVFLNYDMHIAENRLGKERVKYSYNYKTLENLGLTIAFGTDSPVEPVNPFFGIYSSTTRKDRQGFPKNGWRPDESISLYNAIKHYTVDSAYASYDESRKGMIENNFLADFIILDQNPFTIAPENLLNMKVLKTFVGGVLRYEYSDKNR